FIEDGIYKGIAADYVALIEEKTGIDFQVVPNLTWAEAYYEALAGNIDVLPAVSKTAAREEFFLFSDSYYEVKRVIVTLNTNTDIKGITDLYDRTVAVQTNSSHHSFLLDYPQINLSLYDNVDDALYSVSDGSEVAFVGNLATTDYIIKSIGITNLRMSALSSDDPVGIHFAVRQDWPILIDILNKSLDFVTAEEKIEINSRWVTVQVETDYGPIIQVIIFIGSAIILLGAISVFWISKMKKEIQIRKDSQIELEKAKIEAEEANSVKSSFMARMSHEIRTPLNAITGMAYLLKKTDISLTQRMYADRITQASTTMLSLVNDILDYSKIEAGKVELEIVSFNLDMAIQNLISIISIKIEEKGLGFILNKDSSLPSWFMGDQKRIEQILLNILNNAIKFTSEGTITLEIRAVAKENLLYYLEFSVKDTGIGMTQEALSGLFVPFVQADSSINRRFGGTGLGLSIVKNLINLMNGTIDVYSTEGEGSSFVINIALEVDSVKEEEYKKDGSSQYFKDVNTLVLENSASNINIIGSYLSSFGISCELTTSPIGAISMLESTAKKNGKPYDLFIMDYDTPSEKGFEYLKLLRENKKIVKMPKIIMLLPMLRSDLFDMLDENDIDIGIGKPIIPSVLHNGILEIFTYKAMESSEYIKNQDSKATKIDMTILVVEDNITNQLIAKLLLEQSGFDVIIASDGIEGVDQYKKNKTKISLILMDLHMPNMNGYDASDEIRKLSKDIPIIALTAEVIPGIKTKCELHGIHHYISKPFNPEIFISTINEILKTNIIAPNTNHMGINVEKGLKNIGNDLISYHMILIEYKKENQNTSELLYQAVNEKDFEQASTIVHKVKSSSGSIGAEKLYSVALELQKALDTVDKDTIQKDTPIFISLLADVLEQIHEIVSLD
ncbi:MAG: transporter substrate-binding domain-containing protein, partial [Candidatus Izemoplasmatales bacterium]|nr:transporter substrate-binding domain-containing protein [Candidatus Izemoplasmatales bacterium]